MGLISTVPCTIYLFTYISVYQKLLPPSASIPPCFLLQKSVATHLGTQVGPAIVIATGTQRNTRPLLPSSPEASLLRSPPFSARIHLRAAAAAAVADDDDGKPTPAIRSTRAPAPPPPAPPHRRSRLRPRLVPLLLPLPPPRRQLYVSKTLPTSPPFSAQPSAMQFKTDVTPLDACYSHQVRPAGAAGELGREHSPGEEGFRHREVREVS